MILSSICKYENDFLKLYDKILIQLMSSPSTKGTPYKSYIWRRLFRPHVPFENFTKSHVGYKRPPGNCTQYKSGHNVTHTNCTPYKSGISGISLFKGYNMTWIIWCTLSRRWFPISLRWCALFNRYLIVALQRRLLWCALCTRQHIL